MDTYLKHYGVKGMKWGVRRYQNPNGTYTKAGLKRYQKKRDKVFKKAYKAYKEAYEKGGVTELRKNEEFAKAADRLKKQREAVVDAEHNRRAVYNTISNEKWVSKKAEQIWAEREKRLVPYLSQHDEKDPVVRDVLKDAYIDPHTGSWGPKSNLKRSIINDIVWNDERYKDAAQKVIDAQDAYDTVLYDTARALVGRHANKKLTIHEEGYRYRPSVEDFIVNQLENVAYSKK